MKKLFVAISLFAIMSIPSAQAVNLFQKKILEREYRKTDKKLNMLQSKAGSRPTKEQKMQIRDLQTTLQKIKTQLKQ